MTPVTVKEQIWWGICLWVVRWGFFIIFFPCPTYLSFILVREGGGRADSNLTQQYQQVFLFCLKNKRVIMTGIKLCLHFPRWSSQLPLGNIRFHVVKLIHFVTKQSMYDSPSSPGFPPLHKNNQDALFQTSLERNLFILPLGKTRYASHLGEHPRDIRLVKLILGSYIKLRQFL